MLGDFIDSMARVDPSMLHHVYEWYESGNPVARLYSLHYTARDGGLTVYSKFRQSKSFSNGSETVFYNKAEIMESGIPVTIKPKNAQVLAFTDNGEQVFTKGPVVVNSPGGKNVQGSFEATINEFFNTYFSQSFLVELNRYLKTPIDYKVGIAKAKSGGKSAGIQVGLNWISRAGVMK